MIAKRVAINSNRKSNFAGLVEYMVDTKNKNERVEAVRISNCHSDNPQWASQEVMATQALNTRAKTDKTYHLILSFRAGESPSKEVLNAIEDRICDGLGYTGHQRVSAVHNDTDNLHIHIAINKIHPERHTIHEPYYDKKALGDLCEKLEVEYGLERDNHKTRQNEASWTKANDMERLAGVESLTGWIKRECLDSLKHSKSWDEVHKVLAENGLVLQVRGNGLVITNQDGIAVKASSIARELSRAGLEARLGPFDRSGQSPAQTASAKQYAKQPVRQRIDTTELYAKYKAEQNTIASLRTVELAQARDRKNRQIEAAKSAGRVKRSTIKLMGGGFGKKLLYGLSSRSMKGEFERINEQYRRERQDINDRLGKRQTWVDWLNLKATGGDKEALAALRARPNAGQPFTGSTLNGKKGGKEVLGAGRPDGITKQGTLIYRVGKTAIRDDGDRFKVSSGATQDGIEAALRMAMQRYGDRLTVNGTAAFKEQVARAAVAARLSITFDDAALESRRKTLLTDSTKGKANDNDTERGRTDSRRHGGARPDRAGTGPIRGLAGLAGGPGATGGDTRKPDIGRVGRKPPPESQNRLRNLSQLGVVRIADGSEVLLPGDVPNHLEHPVTESNNPVRRDIPRAGMTPQQAADHYIAEREDKRSRGIDILPHRQYRPSDEGVVTYNGTRQVEGHTLALLKREKEIIVMPVDETTAQRISRLSVGDSLTLKPDGSIARKGRSR